MAQYLNLLHKRFLFHVHPDFFTHYPKEQRTNAENLKTLSHVMSGGAASSSTRSLIVYLKPTDFDQQPRRVKVILGSRLAESLREILVDLDTELPEPPASERETKSHFSTAYNTTANPEEVTRFLDSLIDRKDLIAWRIKRNLELNRMQEIVQSILGCSSVELRYSWSAQNNAVLFASLLSLIESIDNRTRLTGLSLVLTADDSSLQPVDAVEAHVLLNPGHVPNQWRSALKGVTPRTIEEAALARTHIDELQKSCEGNLGARIRDNLFASRASPTRLQDHQLMVVIIRGHTCSRRWFRQLLYTYSIDSTQDSELRQLGLCPGDSSTSPSGISASALPPSVVPQGSLGSQSCQLVVTSDTLPSQDTNWLSQLPLTIRIIVEEGHGSKFLPNGDLRIDCRAKLHTIHDLIDEHALQCIAATGDNKRLENAIILMQQSLTDQLGLRSLEPGVGVSSDMFSEFLSRTDTYLRVCALQNKGNRGILNSLFGLRVRVGKYLGLTDDGCVSLPWGISFPTKT